MVDVMQQPTSIENALQTRLSLMNKMGFYLCCILLNRGSGEPGLVERIFMQHGVLGIAITLHRH